MISPLLSHGSSIKNHILKVWVDDAICNITTLANIENMNIGIQDVSEEINRDTGYWKKNWDIEKQIWETKDAKNCV